MDNEYIQVEVEENLVSWVEPKLDVLMLVDTENAGNPGSDGFGSGS